MSTTPRPLRRVPRLAGIAAASALLLSGCGASGWNPGVGISAGDETISNARVEELAAAYCEAIEQQLSDGGQVLPGRYLRGGVAGQLALAAAAEQLAAEHGVEVAGQYDRQVASLETAVADLPEDQQEAVIEVEAAGTYVTEALIAVGEQLLAGEGAADSDREQALQRGQQALEEWLEENEVRIDPSYGVSVVDGRSTPVDTSLSYAVSDVAEQGEAESPDQEYAAGLPENQRCG